jgi:phage baseplate assembly protein W
VSLGNGIVNLAFPFGFDAGGRTAQADPLGHINDMVEQILFTSPGERVNRPTFGSGTARMVFGPNSDILAAAQQQAVQAGIQMWLSDLVRVQSVTVNANDATLVVTVVYTVVQTQQQVTQQFVYGGTGQ